MLPGLWQNREVDLTAINEGVGRVKGGTLAVEDLTELEEQCCPGCGSCAGMFTANSMNCLAEALGMALPGNGTIPAVNSARLRLAKRSGRMIMELLNRNIRPRDICTPHAFRNAMAVDLAMGCSTNTVLHVPAIAREAGILIHQDMFQENGGKGASSCEHVPGRSSPSGRPGSGWRGPWGVEAVSGTGPGQRRCHDRHRQELG